MRKIVLTVLVALLGAVLATTTVSFAEEASSQSTPVTKKQKKSKKPTAAENASTKKVKKEEVYLPDERDIASDYATQAIRLKIIKYFQSGNISPMIGDLLIDAESPLTIQLSTAEGGSMDFAHTINSDNITGKGTLTAKDMKYSVVQKNGSNLPGSAKDAVWVSSKDTAAKIISGELAFAGSFKVKDKPISFSNGSIVFKDLVKQGTFTEGTIIDYDGIKYTYKSGWKKQL